jgi:hypothetical protein
MVILDFEWPVALLSSLISASFACPFSGMAVIVTLRILSPRRSDCQPTIAFLVALGVILT